jgi:hypothetical protein
MLRPLIMTAGLCLWLGASAAAQTVQHEADSADVLVLDHNFGTMGELVRLFLQDKQVYRAELSSEDVTLEIRPRVPGMRTPRVYEITSAQSPSGSSVVEIYPDQDGEYELRAISLHGSRLPSRLRLYRDVIESSRRLTPSNRSPWDLGIEISGGWHSGFSHSGVASAPGTSLSSGSNLEACFSARSTPGVPRLNLCVLGLSRQSQPNAGSILWLYTEPRVRILGRVRPGFSNWEAGALLRFGVGLISGGSTKPTVVGPGVYVARHLRRKSTGSSWSLQASYSRALYRGFGNSSEADRWATRGSHRVSFGIGWYR